MAAPVPLEMLSFDADALPREIDVTGEIVGGARWRDGNGENVLVLTETGALPTPTGDCAYCGDAEVYAAQYVRNQNRWARLWLVTDFERNCQFDLVASFLEDALTITDLDGDGVAESTFLYVLTCTSDVSPSTLKLIMHEGATKYAIRGTTDLSAVLGKSEFSGGDRNIDPAFRRADPRQREYALRQWDRHVKQHDGT